MGGKHAEKLLSFSAQSKPPRNMVPMVGEPEIVLIVCCKIRDVSRTCVLHTPSSFLHAPTLPAAVVCARLGAAEVVATDLAPNLPLLRENCEANGKGSSADAGMAAAVPADLTIVGFLLLI